MPTVASRPALSLGFAALLGFALATGAALAQDDEPVEVEIQPIAGPLSLLLGGVGNTVVSNGEQGLLVVDTKLQRHGDALDAALAQVSEYLPSYVVNTHWHEEQTGNNDRYGAAAQVLAHENVRRRLAGDAEIGGRVAQGTPQEALPDITHRDGAKLFFNGERIRLIHLPNAHTDGDTAVWFEGSGVACLGDVYCPLGYPLIDVDSGGDVRGVIAGVERVLELVPEGTRFVPARGGVTGAEELREYLEMLTTTSSRVSELLDAGKTADEIVAAAPTEEFDVRWGGAALVSPEQFLRSIVTSYGQAWPAASDEAAPSDG